MRIGRLRYAEWIAGGAGAALVALLFTSWYGVRGGAGGERFDRSAFEAFAFVDWALLVCAFFGVALAAATAASRTDALPMVLAGLALLAGIVASMLVAVRLAWPPTLELPAAFGGGEGEVAVLAWAWLALGAALALAAGAWQSMYDERLSRATAAGIASGELSPHPRRLPAPPPDGG